MMQVLEIAGQLVQLVGAGVGLYTAVVLARRARGRRKPERDARRPCPGGGDGPAAQGDRAA
ncbi:hypothetical protein ABZU32_35835 [Sphaerisporangium sp. NPDC005288]|uniref:hypothetical protein n=1 Tax=Sphaerisporangium sp. NPDC005288 TaxID=3155114 RepID=UPI0033A0027F